MLHFSFAVWDEDGDGVAENASAAEGNDATASVYESADVYDCEQ